MVHRARERLSTRRRRFVVDDETRVRMLKKFISAIEIGDRDRIIELLAQDATMISDGGGKAIASLRPLIGPQRIAMLWFAVARRRPAGVERHIVSVNGEPGVALKINGALHSVATIETDGERVHRYFTIANPDKLRSFAALFD
jgi:RNA polymerase sigma-70 factor (ECF subfamily)